MSAAKAKSPVCALDTQTLIWGLRDVGKSGRPEMEERARILLELLDEDEAEIVIPAVAASELITPLETSLQTAFLAELTRRFRVVPFDIPAASLAAELYRKFKKAVVKAGSGNRVVFRADTLIIASARVAGATIFYSDDKTSRDIASAVMDARALPTHDERLPFRS